MDRPQTSPKETRVQLSLILSSLILAVFLAEGLSRTLIPPPKAGHFLHEPGIEILNQTDPEIMPGVEGVARFVVNSRGMRAPEPSPKFDFQILALGGSTTECVYLDQTEAWPALLQTHLNERQHHRNVWVGNAGKTGVTTREHRYQVPILLEEYPDLDWMILLVGVNDVLMRLARDIHYDPFYPDKPESQENLVNRGFGYIRKSDEDRTWYEHLRLWQLFRRAFPGQPISRDPTLGKIHIEDTVGESYRERRRYRREAPDILDRLPEMGPALDEYERNVVSILEANQTRGVRSVLVTQPVLWDPELPEDLQHLLWAGGVQSIFGEGLLYYSVEALSEAMNEYNDRLRKIASDRNLDLIDLAAEVPKDTTIFYDDCHFNENGARVVADKLATYLLTLPPLSG